MCFIINVFVAHNSNLFFQNQSLGLAAHTFTLQSMRSDPFVQIVLSISGIIMDTIIMTSNNAGY